MRASLLYDSKCILAESPYWKADWNSFLWVDIERGDLFSFEVAKSNLRKWHFPHRLTLVLEEEGGKLILALDAKLARFDPDIDELEWLLDVGEDQDFRCNDGACDPQGRIWVGSLKLDFKEGAGALYCVDHALTLTKKVSDVTISNGLAWSLDGNTLYFIDSPTRKVKAFAFDQGTGGISYFRDAITVPEDLGSPDGMCMDKNGMLWVGHYGGSGVYCWNPGTGELLDKVDVDAPHVTSCAFGGKEGNLLLITTAKENMTPEGLERYPKSGGVFLVEMAVKGAEVFTAKLK